MTMILKTCDNEGKEDGGRAFIQAMDVLSVRPGPGKVSCVVEWRERTSAGMDMFAFAPRQAFELRRVHVCDPIEDVVRQVEEEHTGARNARVKMAEALLKPRPSDDGGAEPAEAGSE